MTLAFVKVMSKRFLVAAEVNGKVRFLSLTASIVGLRDARKLSRRMAAKLFRGQKLGKIVIERWPKIGPSR